MGYSRLITFMICMALSVGAIGQLNLPLTQQAVNYFEAKDLVSAQTAIVEATQSATEKDHPYAWCVKGFVFKEIYKDLENMDPYSTNRDIAVEAILYSMELDKNGEYRDSNIKILKFLASTMYNDVVQSARTLTEYTIDEPEKFYQKYKDVWRVIYPEFDYSFKDTELYRVLGEANNKIYKKNPAENIEYFDRAINYYEKALMVSPADTISNYNLAILYYNKGVQKIKTIDHNTSLFSLITIQDECIALFKQSLPYMKKAHDLDPYRKEPIMGLRAIYKSLSEIEQEEYYVALLEQYIREGKITQD